MPKSIIVPLYKHVTDAEAQELADDIERVFGLALKPYVVEVIPKPCTKWHYGS